MSKLIVGDVPIPSKFSDDSNDAFCSVDDGRQKTRVMNEDRFVKQVFESTDKVDRRMLQLIKVQ